MFLSPRTMVRGESHVIVGKNAPSTDNVCSTSDMCLHKIVTPIGNPIQDPM